jgi:hypothetical protein
MATHLGEITLRILKGAKPEDIPIEECATGADVRLAAGAALGAESRSAAARS